MISKAALDKLGGAWMNTSQIPVLAYTCPICGKSVAPDKGYFASDPGVNAPGSYFLIRLCPNCRAPTLFWQSKILFPDEQPGSHIDHLPEELSQLYQEARFSSSAGAYTCTVLACRKMLMHIAVAKGAKEGGSFQSYVDYLNDNHYIPPDGKAWVDYIRARSNEANHQIVLMKREDAHALIILTEMLLRFIFEFPNRVPPLSASTTH